MRQDDDKRTNGHKGYEAKAASVSFDGAGALTPYTGDSDVDHTVAILQQEGFAYRNMAMPFPLVIMHFNNNATKRSAVIIYKDGRHPVETPTGLIIHESMIALGRDDDAGEPSLVPVRTFLAERRVPRP